MNVLIAGRTRMHGNGRCIGGLLDDGSPVRLLRAPEQHWDNSAPFQIGDIWDLTLTPATIRPAPHTEDAVVSAQTFVGKEPNLRARILELTNPWTGGISKVFDGKLRFTGNNNGYISQSGVPNHSTGFWIPDKDLSLRADGRHYDYPQFTFFRRGLSYVGEPAAVPNILKGTLVRVSLAGWWKPDDVDIEERCYLQLSGWF